MDIKTTDPELKDKVKKPKRKDYVDALLIAVIVALFLKLFFVEAYRIPSGSMENTLLVGDFLLVNKFVYGTTTPRNIPFTNIRMPFFRFPGYKNPKKGDIVVFDFPGTRDEVKSANVINYIKRLIGEPGDVIEIRNAVLYVNGTEFQNSPDSKLTPRPQNIKISDSRIFPKGSGWNEDNYGPLKVPKAGDVLTITPEMFQGWKVFVEREGSTIDITPDNKIIINGTETNQYTVKNNYYFMMGDNRNNSLDSRFWGFMPEDNIVGEGWIIYWSWNPEIPFSDPGTLISSVRWDRIAKIIR